jgi:hypothetical protein
MLSGSRFTFPLDFVLTCICYSDDIPAVLTWRSWLAVFLATVGEYALFMASEESLANFRVSLSTGTFTQVRSSPKSQTCRECIANECTSRSTSLSRRLQSSVSSSAILESPKSQVQSFRPDSHHFLELTLARFSPRMAHPRPPPHAICPLPHRRSSSLRTDSLARPAHAHLLSLPGSSLGSPRSQVPRRSPSRHRPRRRNHLRQGHLHVHAHWRRCAHRRHAFNLFRHRCYPC